MAVGTLVFKANVRSGPEADVHSDAARHRGEATLSGIRRVMRHDRCEGADLVCRRAWQEPRRVPVSAPLKIGVPAPPPGCLGSRPKDAKGVGVGCGGFAIGWRAIPSAASSGARPGSIHETSLACRAGGRRQGWIPAPDRVRGRLCAGWRRVVTGLVGIVRCGRSARAEFVRTSW
jgi:hypothetical protein